LAIKAPAAKIAFIKTASIPKGTAFRVLRQERTNLKLVGRRAKKAKEAAEKAAKEEKKDAKAGGDDAA
jgi:hypothetical protein